MPYIQVKILAGTPQPLTYFADQDIPCGTLVRVPLRQRTVTGVVIEAQATRPTKFDPKPIVGIEPLPDDPLYYDFLQTLAAYYQQEPAHLLTRLQAFLAQKAQDEKPLQISSEPNQQTVIELTDAQQKIVQAIAPHITASHFYPALLHGVTGSGKTIVYRSLIEQALAEKGTALLLLPEVSMAATFQTKFRQWFPESQVLGFHSATSASEKRALWQGLIAGKPLLIVGVHLPPLLPIPNLKLIIVDEEHEVGFQEKRHPKLNSKHAALMRAQEYGIPILFGSATPSIASLAQVKARKWAFFQLKDRYSGSFPTIRVVPLLNKERRSFFWITKQLESAITQRLQRREQAIIFINRRGYCFFVQCKGCSYVFSCTSCSVSLTLHQEGGESLRCHYCGFTCALPQTCPSCSSAELLKKGIGTQQIVSVLQAKFPIARIARADLDATVSRKRWQATVQAMERNELDILVGTQSITKGYHFPNVTLVGVLWADINLHFPIFNAAETCLAQLIQVAGRAGRASQESEVIIQTMLDHPIYQYVNEVDYLKFYAHEIAHRTALGYPPAQHLVELEIKHKKEDVVERESWDLVTLLQQHNNQRVQILGPAKPPVHKIQNTHTRKIYLKAGELKDIERLYSQVTTRKWKSSIFYVPNPVTI